MQVHDEHSGTERLAWAMVSRKCITGRHIQHPTCLHSRKAHAEQLATGGSSSASKDLPRQVCKGAQHSRIPGKSRGPERLSHSGGIHPAAPCNAEMGMNPKFPSYPSGCSFDTDRSSCMSPVIYRVLAGQETCVTPFGFSVLIFTCCGKIKWIPVQLEDPACTGVLQEYHCSVQFKAGWMLWMTTVIIKTTGFSPPHFNLNEICQIISDDLFPR